MRVIFTDEPPENVRRGANSRTDRPHCRRLQRSGNPRAPRDGVWQQSHAMWWRWRNSAKHDRYPLALSWTACGRLSAASSDDTHGAKSALWPTLLGDRATSTPCHPRFAWDARNRPNERSLLIELVHDSRCIGKCWGGDESRPRGGNAFTQPLMKQPDRCPARPRLKTSTRSLQGRVCRKLCSPGLGDRENVGAALLLGIALTDRFARSFLLTHLDRHLDKGSVRLGQVPVVPPA